jgi:hypothetical protein
VRFALIQPPVTEGAVTINGQNNTSFRATLIKALQSRMSRGGVLMPRRQKHPFLFRMLSERSS